MKTRETTKNRKFALLLAICMLAATIFPALRVHAASTTKLYVLTSYGDGKSYNEDFTYDKNGRLIKKTSISGATYQYTYKSGLLTKQTEKGVNGDSSTWTYTYDDNRLSQVTHKDSYGFKTTTAYSYDSKNRIVKSTYEESGPEAMSGTYTYTYNKKGYITKEAYKGQMSGQITYTYDSKGTTKTYKSDYSSFSMKGTYKSGRLSKLKIKDKTEGNSYTYKFTYKQISVPKDSVATVKAQQEALMKQACWAPQFVF